MAVFDDKYVATDQVKLAMSENRISLSGDSLKIVDFKGKTMYEGDNALVTRSDTKIKLKDWDGHKFGSIKKNKVTTEGSVESKEVWTYTIENRNDDVLYTAKPSRRFGVGGKLSWMPGGALDIFEQGGSDKAFTVEKALWGGLINKVHDIKDVK